MDVVRAKSNVSISVQLGKKNHVMYFKWEGLGTKDLGLVEQREEEKEPRE